MFDKKSYQNACDRLTLDAEKLEEIIAMTENTSTKRRMSRPMKTVLIAAACVAALTVTAMAAPAVQQLFMTYTITYRNADSSTVSVMPTLTLTETDGRSILTVDGLETDVTDAFAQDGQYTTVVDGSTITVKPDGWVKVEAPGDEDVTYTFNLLSADADSTFISVDGEELTGGELGQYKVTTDENGSIEVTELDPAQ